MSWSRREDWLSGDNGDQKDFHDSSCQFLPEFLLAGERRWVGWLSAVHPVLRTLTVNHQLQAPGLPKNKKLKVWKEIDSPTKCDPGKTKWNYSSHTAKTAEKRATRAKTHERWRADNPLRSGESTQLNPHREQRSVDKKVQIHLPKNGLPRTWREKKTPEEPNTITPCYSGHFLQHECFFFHLLFCDSILLDGNLYQECATWSKKSSSQPQARMEGKRKNPQNCIREEKSLRT